MELKIQSLNAMRITKLFIAASRWLSRYADVLNDLNVYPVPDGDTGTNMSMTLQSVENELVKLDHEPDMQELSEIIAEAVLLGARGNSGTILSQIVQGFLSVVQESDEVSIEQAGRALMAAKDKAYQAVSNPVEGTILTVIRKVAEAAKVYEGEEDFIPFLIYIKEAAAKAVEETPNELPKLKEAGVVDAGGKGIFYILEGFEKSVSDPDMLEDLERISKSKTVKKEQFEITATEDITFQYCTEFIIESGSFSLEEYKGKISSLGDSMVCAQTTKKTKTHIHSNHPGQVLEIAGSYGDLNNIKIENMKTQHQNLLVTETELVESVEPENFLLRSENAQPVAYFAIVDNQKLGACFLEDGATAVLIGGQTQNPSVADIEEGLKKIHAEQIVILPNNKNIIGSAKIAAERSEKDVIVVETTSMLQGQFLVQRRQQSMEYLLKQSKENYSIEITKASRNTKIGDLEIKEGDCIALVNGKVVAKAATNPELVKKLYADYLDEATLSVFVVTGEGSDEETAGLLRDLPAGIRYREFDGQQANYPYYIYVEQRDPNLPEIAVVTDSAADISPELAREKNIHVVAMRVKMGEKNYADGLTLSKRDFWKKVLVENIIPKTSQPSPATFHKVYEDLNKQGYKKIITILISNKLSGTHHAAKIAREMMGEACDIRIIDSKAATFAQAHQVFEAKKMVDAGMDIDDIVARVEDMRDKVKVYFAVKDLKFLQKGGRIGKASSVIGGFLRVKPVLKLENGEVSLAAKVIGERGALSYLEKLLKAESKKNSILVYNGWGGGSHELETADTLKKFAEDYRKIEYKGRFEIGATIGSHSGPVYGFAYISKIR